MKKLGLLTILAGFLAAGTFAANTEDAETVYSVDTDKSKVHWVGKKVTGQHNGTLNLEESEVYVEEGKVVRASVTMDMNSIVVEDITDAGSNQKLVGHLKSDDFFSAEKFPTATFATTGFEADAGGTDYVVTGNLTIKGITREIAFPVSIEINGNELVANGTATLDRTEWDIRYGSGSFFDNLGDNMIYDEFEIEFDLVASPEEVTSQTLN